MTSEFDAVLQAPFVRRHVLARVKAVVERYDALLRPAPLPLRSLRGSRRTTADNQVPVLFRFPSALREQRAVARATLERRRMQADEEWRALRAAAPLPAPDDRPDRLRIQALAEAQWLARELRALRRAARGRAIDVAIELYHETRPEDPLPNAEGLLPAIRAVPRGGLINTAFAVAQRRYGVPDLLGWMTSADAEAAAGVNGPVSAGEVATFEVGGRRCVTVRDRPVVVFRLGDQWRAVGALCPHRGGALDQGDIEDGAIVCPLHEWAFDLITGRMRGRPTVTVPTYRVDVQDGEVWVYP